MRRVLGVLLVTGGVVLGGVPAAASQAPRHDTIRVDTGVVRGTVGHDSRVYQGIPYAAPPVGDLRWHSPAPPARWTGVRDATVPGNRCPQAALPGRPSSDTEDCLNLNVTAPRSAHRRPVLVWLHGGGLTSGAGSEYDATRLASRGDLVVVTVNYRLGNLGFFDYPGLPNGGAFGIEDQQAALRWVRRNIAAFGGDPRNVTLAGESAGAHSVCAQLASPGAAGLFQRAIGQSTPCVANAFAGSAVRPLLDIPYFVPKEWHTVHSQNVATQLGCADLDCLRAAPASALVGAPVLPLPEYGNAVLPEDPAVAVPAGRFHHVPFLTGGTRDEGTLFAPLLFPGLTPDGYDGALAAHFGAHAPAVAAEYPVRDYGGSAVQAMGAIMSDLDWALAQQVTETRFATEVPTYAYEFLDRTAPAILEFPPGVTPLASHGSELKFLFDFPYDTRPLTSAQRRLGATMIDYWSRFAATGDPNRAGLPHWQRVRPGHDYVQGLDLGRPGRYDRAAAHHFDFWRALV
jgi:para-nitrobenzyl esterase